MFLEYKFRELISTSFFQFTLMFFFIFLNFYDGYAQVKTKSTCDSLIKIGLKKLDQNKNKESLVLLLKALNLAKDNDWFKEEYQALNNIGTNYYRLSENGEALTYYLEAQNIAGKKLTLTEQIKVLNNIAIIYFEEKKYTQAISYFKKVYSTAKQNNDSITRGIAAINLGTLSLETKKFEVAKSYYNDALLLLTRNVQYEILAKGGLANCNLLLGDTKLARESAQDLISNTKNLEFYHLEIELLLIISKSYLKENKLDLALLTINKIVSKKPNLDTKLNLYTLLAEIYTKNGRLDLAIKYKDSLFISTEKLNEVKNKKIFENGKIKFELQNYKNQLALNDSKAANEKRLLYFLLLSIIIVVAFILLSLRNKSFKLKQKKLIAERNEQILILELENKKSEGLLLEKQFNETKAISLLEQEKLKNEVEVKNRKLTTRALYLSGKNQMIEEILSELLSITQVSKNDMLVNHIKNLKDQLKTDKEWNKFIKHFEEVNQGFLNSIQLKHPELKINDIRYISYIYMGLNSKEIALLLNITLDSCRKRKERVLQKMKLSKETNLYEYLTTLKEL